MIEKMLPAVINVLDLFVNFRLFGFVASGDELFSKLFQMRLILTKEVDLLHAVLQCEKVIEINIFIVSLGLYRYIHKEQIPLQILKGMPKVGRLNEQYTSYNNKEIAQIIKQKNNAHTSVIYTTVLDVGLLIDTLWLKTEVNNQVNV